MSPGSKNSQRAGYITHTAGLLGEDKTKGGPSTKEEECETFHTISSNPHVYKLQKATDAGADKVMHIAMKAEAKAIKQSRLSSVKVKQVSRHEADSIPTTVTESACPAPENTLPSST